MEYGDVRTLPLGEKGDVNIEAGEWERVESEWDCIIGGDEIEALETEGELDLGKECVLCRRFGCLPS